MATTTYTTDAAIKARVAAGLQVDVASLPANWDVIIAQSNTDASAEIKRVFILKGYTPGQVASADDVVGWATRLGAFFAFVNGTSLAQYDLKGVEHLDCRKEFMEASALIIDDAAVGPPSGNSEVGGIQSGSVSAVADEERRFRRF